MNSGDWALIIYTLAIQSAAGIFVASRLVVAGETEKAIRMRLLWLVGGLGAVGLLASFLHLGSPLNALLTMSNLSSSWLSREILFTLLFAGAWLVSLVLEMRGVGSHGLRNGWAAVAGLLGLSLVYVMSMIYRSLAFPAWAHVSTTASFFATTGLIGTVAVFASQCMRKGDEEPRGMTALLFSALAMLVLQMMTISSHAAYLGSAGKEAQMTAAMLSGSLVGLLWARVALVVVGAAVVMPWAWRRMSLGKLTAPAPVAGALVALVGLGELLGRLLFYVTRVKIGL